MLFHLMIGSNSLKPQLRLTAAQHSSSSPNSRIRRQMELESVPGLSEMSFTSAAHKEFSSQTVGDYTAEKKESVGIWVQL